MIGAIADDVTGGTDVAVAFNREGIRTLLFFGLPPEGEELPPHDAVVIALKSRMSPPEEAVSESLAAAEWLRRAGARQLYFKYCSTFDSTARGNIGPVLDALADALDAPTVLMTPSSPEHLRTQYQGYLFVNDVLLSESHMRHHPLTPMTDSYLPRVLQEQTTREIGLIPHAVVRSGEDAIREALDQARSRSERYVLADAVSADDLRALGAVAQGETLIAGAAGLAGGLAAAIASRAIASRAAASHAADATGQASTEPVGQIPAGRAAVLSGSCSARTLEQIAVMEGLGHPLFRLDAVAEPDPAALAGQALAWYDALPTDGAAPLLYSSLAPAELKSVQEALGVERSASILEEATGRIAVGLVERGVRRLIAAGGETSGAVVSALGVSGGLIGSEQARGVPWIHTMAQDGLALLLKSGNFGEPELLATASAPPEASR